MRGDEVRIEEHGQYLTKEVMRGRDEMRGTCAVSNKGSNERARGDERRRQGHEMR